ncbi:TRAP transporter small permease [Rossellomorea aquimaris]|uniref:TRAP transporter small permease n=1 Tax=Rossellomorea aquimaris TaxID=189382 RepID=UPI001CD54512|nr:TRAP transporter small permease [Rossellomorea aquimaris]MCA1060280.1 TRAP transporter small permease [Rossellomorea aquimaris]
MGSVTKGFMQLTHYINKVVGWLLFIMLAVMSILIFWQVFARFVVGNSLTFSEEASRFLMIWLTLLGAGYAIKEGALISIDLLQSKLSGIPGKILQTVMSVIACSFYIILIVYGFSMAQAISFQVAPTTGISMFWPMLALPAGGALMLLNTIAALIENVGKGEEPA